MICKAGKVIKNCDYLITRYEAGKALNTIPYLLLLIRLPAYP